MDATGSSIDQQTWTEKALTLGAFGGAVAGAAAVGARASMQPKRWYRLLRKAPLNPPDWVFGPVWTVLYGLIAWSGFRAFRRSQGRRRAKVLATWSGQLALNAAWSPLFFGRHRARSALVDIGALLAAIAVYTRTAARVDRAAAWMMAPYLGWVGFATYLNAEIVGRNRLLGQG